MSRGKYKTAAEARRVREGALSEVETGRREIVRLTNENRELQQRLNETLATHTTETARLRIALAAGVAPQVTALQERLRAEASAAGFANGQLKAYREHFSRLSSRYFEHLRIEHGLRESVAMDIVAKAANVLDEEQMVAGSSVAGQMKDMARADLNTVVGQMTVQRIGVLSKIRGE